MFSSKSLLSLVLAALVLPRANALDAILTDDVSINVTKPPRVQKSDRLALQFSEENHVFLKFDIESILPPNVTSSRIEKATLVVYVNSVKGNTWGAFFGVYPVLLGAWSERDGLVVPIPNFSELPSIGGLIEAKPLFYAKTYVAFDVTSLVKSWIDGTPNRGMVLKGWARSVVIPPDGSPTLAAEGAIDSKENSATSHPARLQISLISQ